MNQDNPYALAAGTVLEGRQRYTIERVLGAGGFGITYLAVTDIGTDGEHIEARVAIKEHFVDGHNERAADDIGVVAPGTSFSRTLVADSLHAFLHEARRLQTIGSGHPSIVKVNEVFEANGTGYYVMEYIEGSSLWDAVAGRGMAEADVLTVMRPIVGAVAYLHLHRLTHLDIKPQNIMLDTEGGRLRPVLIDFGLCKHYDADGRATSRLDTHATSEGYSPVEQYSGLTTFTPAADVYALGATMIACITGQRPPKSTEWLVSRRMNYIATLSVSAELRTALEGALMELSGRYADAGTFLSVLPGSDGAPTQRISVPETEKPTSTQPLLPPVPPPFVPENSAPRRRTALWAVLAAVAALALGTVTFFVVRRALAGTQEEVAAAAAPVAATSASEDETLPAATDTDVPAATPVRAGRARAWADCRQPRNMSLAVERDGVRYYFTHGEWEALSPAERQACRKLGVVVVARRNRFIVALDEEPGFYTWPEAMGRFGDSLPTKAQAEAWINCRGDLQAAVRAFGGTMPALTDVDARYPDDDPRRFYWYWTRTPSEVFASSAWCVISDDNSVYVTAKTDSCRVRRVTAL